MLGSKARGSNVLGSNVLGSNVLGSNVLGSNVLGSNVLGSKMAALAFVTLGALALAGCGGGKPGSPGSSTPAKKSDTLTLLRTDTKGSLQKAADTTGKAKSVAMSMQGTSGGTQVKAHGVVAMGSPLTARIVSTDSKNGDTEIRIMGTVFYVQIPAKDRADTDGKSWMKVDFSKDAKAADQVGRQFNDADPAKQLKTLLDGGGTVTVVGEETVADTKTVHYTATAPLGAYLANVDQAIRPQVEKALSTQGVKEIKTDLWVDGQYLIRRSHAVVGNTDMTVDYSEYGKPVDVTAPPAADTFDLSDMLNKLKSGITG